MDYRDFSTEDFVLDSFFQSWVKHKTPASNEFWKAWVVANPGKARAVEEARELLLCLDFRADDPSPEEIRMIKDALLKKFRNSRQGNGKGAVSGAKVDSIRGRRRFLFSYPVAAVAVFLLFASLAAVYFLFSPKFNISTTFGETTNLNLPDGSRVTLNANSRISYAKNWDEESGREVWLEGEAFFEITKAPQSTHPEFLVHVGEVTIKVLGTAFNVYRRGSKTSVVLQEGSVELTSENSAAVPGKLLMKPGDKVDIQGSQYKIEQVPVAPFVAWKDHRMLFENTALSGIARMLEDNYGYRVVFKDPRLRNLRFTGSYSTKRVDVFLKALGEAFDIEVTTTDKTITFQ